MSFRRAWHAGKVTDAAPGETGDGPPERLAKVLRIAPDPGIFGPQSVTWRVHADPLLGLGGLRALLLQAVHPLAMAGVSAHSQFRDDPWGRLVRTAQYIGTVTYGTTADARRAAARVRGLHRTVNGIDPQTHRAYSATDPELLTWVHVTEVDSFLTTARRGGLKLTDDEADRYVAEQARSGALLGVPATLAPQSVDEIADYYAQMRPQLRMAAQAREAARYRHPSTDAAQGGAADPGAPGLVRPGRARVRPAPPLDAAHVPASRPADDRPGGDGWRHARCTPGSCSCPQSWRDGPAVTAAKQRLGLD